jgi:hypothetical protein
MLYTYMQAKSLNLSSEELNVSTKDTILYIDTPLVSAVYENTTPLANYGEMHYMLGNPGHLKLATIIIGPVRQQVM